MRYLMIFKNVGEAEPGVPPCKEDRPEMAKLVEEITKSGVLLWTEGLQPSARGARVRLDGGKLTLTDGPFTEAKELIAGACMVQVNSKQEAVEIARRFLQAAGGGEGEIRQVYEASDYTRTSH